MPVGSNSVGRVSNIKIKKPALPAIDKDLAGDTVFRGQRNEAHRAMSDYMARQTSSENSFDNKYTRNVMEQNRQQGFAQEDQADDFASRGMSHSGARVEADSNLKTDYSTRFSDLADGRAQFMTGSTNGLTDFRSTQRINDTRFRNEAINRRAAAVSANNGIPPVGTGL